MNFIEENLLTPQMQAKPDRLDRLWFYYWKYSPSLWKSELQKIKSQSKNSNRIFIPVYWSHHSTDHHLSQRDQLLWQRQGSGGQASSQLRPQYDFGRLRRENNLLELYRCCMEVGLKPLILLPLGPIPFLPCGGMPARLAAEVMRNEAGLAVTTLTAQGQQPSKLNSDTDQQIHKMYSFFDKKVFRDFCFFLDCLVDAFYEDQQIFHKVEIYGIESFYADGSGLPVSFFKDYSQSFQNHYQYQLKKNSAITVDQCHQDLRNLYLSVMKDVIGRSYKGELELFMLGYSPELILSSSFFKTSVQSVLFRDLNHAIQQNYFIGTQLIDPQGVTPTLLKAISSHGSESYYRKRFVQKYIDDPGMEYQLLQLVQFFGPKNCFAWQWLREIGLQSFMATMNSGEIIFQDELRIDMDGELEENRIMVCQGRQLDYPKYQDMVKYFLQGGVVLLDTAHLGEDLVKKWNWFLVENKLSPKKIHYHSDLEILQMGQGRIIIIDSTELAKLKDQHKQDLWTKIFHFAEVSCIPMVKSEGIEHLWYTRPCGVHELNFMEFRRLYLYNPTSYQLTAKLTLYKKFALVKILDNEHCKVRSQVGGYVEVSLSPQGSVVIDLGRYHQ